MTTYTADSIQGMLEEHKDFFNSGVTKEVSFRLQQLLKLKNIIKQYEGRIITALQQDLGKGEFEAYATEIGFTLDSIGYMMKHLKRWAKPKKVRSPLHLFPAKSYILSEPYGTTLIIVLV